MKKSTMLEKSQRENIDQNTVILNLEKVWTYVQTGDPHVSEIIDKRLCVMVPERHFSMKYKMGLWDGTRHFFDTVQYRFLTGFTNMVIDELKKHGYIVEVCDETNIRPTPVEVDDVELNGIDKDRFREVQLPLLQNMLRLGRGSLRLATGGGKTEIMAGVAKVLKDKKVLIIVHRVELLQQTLERLEKRLGEPIGQISSKGVDLQRVTVGMVLTIWNKRQVLRDYLKNQVGVVISDECHNSTSSTWGKVLMVTEAKRRWGVSGTPLKKDTVRDMLLIGLTGDVIQGASVVDLVKVGYAVMPHVRLIDTVSLLGKYNLGRKVPFSDVHNHVYNDVRLWGLVRDVLRWHNKKGVLIFTERVAVCEGLTDYLSTQGFKVGSSYGKVVIEERLKVLQQFKKGEIDVLVTTVVLDEGVDVPSVSGIVLVTTNKSVVRLMQRIGRSVRIDEGKDKTFIYDFVINAPFLKTHILQRLDMYKKEEFITELWKYDGNQFIQSM